MNNQIYVIAKYCDLFKLIGLPFRPIKEDIIIDKGIYMAVSYVTINKDSPDGIIINVEVDNGSYNDKELYEYMMSKGWRKYANP